MKSAFDAAAEAPPAIEWTPRSVRRQAFRGAIALGFRQAFVVGVNLMGGIALARILTPTQFGLYAVFVFTLSILGVFGDVGLGASLIRSKAAPTIHQYRVVFTAQQFLLAIGLVALLLLAPMIATAYRLPPEDAWLFRLVALSMIPASLKVIPSIRLERDLRFERLAAVEVSQTVVYNVTAVTLAVLGFGVWGLAVALVAQELVGAVLVNLVSRWSIGLAWDGQLVRTYLGFGLPYQASSWVSLAKDSLNPVLVGLVLGAAQVGYLNWALTLAAYPVLALMMLQRIYLPAFSRMQQHPEELGRFVTMVVRGTNTIIAPLAMLCLVLAVPITRIVFGDKWMPAIPYFYFLWTANLFVATATPLYGLLNALGRSRLALGFSLLWMITTWIFGLPLIAAFGPIGFAAGNALVQLTNFLLYWVARRSVSFHLMSAVLPPWLIAMCSGLAVALFGWVVPIVNLVLLAFAGVAGLTIYAAITIALYPTETRAIRALLRDR